jgi:hypothetical protein
MTKLTQQTESFICSNGQRLHTAADLALALYDMDDGVFYHHCTDSKNDFAHWMAHAYGRDDVATRIGNIKEKHALMIELFRCICEEVNN